MCMPTLFMSLAMAQPTQRAVWGALTSSQHVNCWLERKVSLVATSDPVSCLASQRGRFGAQRCCDWGHLSRSSGLCHGSCTGCDAMAHLQHVQPASAPHKLAAPASRFPLLPQKLFVVCIYIILQFIVGVSDLGVVTQRQSASCFSACSPPRHTATAAAAAAGCCGKAGGRQAAGQGEQPAQSGRQRAAGPVQHALKSASGGCARSVAGVVVGIELCAINPWWHAARSSSLGDRFC